MEDNKVEIKFELADVTNRFLLHLKSITDYVTNIYHAIEKLDLSIYKPLPTDDFPIIIADNKTQLTIDEQKQLTLNWTLTKAFEEFINGLMKSFKETYRYLKIYTLSQQQEQIKTKNDLENELQKINNDTEKFSFPDFVSQIENLINQTLPLKEEVLSINKLRNCLVHRDGIVTEKDTKNSDTKDLRLKWISLKFWTNINGKQTEMTFDLRKNGVTVNELSMQTYKKEKVFKLGDKILLDINEFNSLAYTCASFTNGLYLLMPIPKQNNKSGA